MVTIQWVQVMAGAIGGGLIPTILTLVNFRMNRKSQVVDLDEKKLDFAQKSVSFMDTENDKLMKRVQILEEKVENLVSYKCEKLTCKNRIPARETTPDNQ